MPRRRPVNRVTPSRKPKIAGIPTRPVPPKAEPREAAAPAGELPDAVPADAAPESAPGPKWRPSGNQALLTALVIATVALAVVAGTAAYFTHSAAPNNTAYVDAAATDQVKAAAANALKTLYAYDANEPNFAANYKERVHAVLTGAMAAEFDKTSDVTIAGIQQTKTKTEAQVDPVGVTNLHGDQAELLLYLNVSASKNGIAQESASGPLVVRMTKDRGSWKAADIIDKD